MADGGCDDDTTCILNPVVQPSMIGPDPTDDNSDEFDVSPCTL